MDVSCKFKILKLKTERQYGLGGIVLQATAVTPSLQSNPTSLGLETLQTLSLYIIQHNWKLWEKVKGCCVINISPNAYNLDCFF